MDVAYLRWECAVSLGYVKAQSSKVRDLSDPGIQSLIRSTSFLGHTIMSGLSITIDASQTTAVEIQPFPAPSSAVASSSLPAHATSKMSSRARVAEAAQERLWTELTSLYSDNRELESKATKSTSRDKDGSAGDDIASTLDSLLETFLNGADIVLNELSTLGNAHPVLAGMV